MGFNSKVFNYYCSRQIWDTNKVSSSGTPLQPTQIPICFLFLPDSVDFFGSGKDYGKYFIAFKKVNKMGIKRLSSATSKKCFKLSRIKEF